MLSDLINESCIWIDLILDGEQHAAVWLAAEKTTITWCHSVMTRSSRPAAHLLRLTVDSNRMNINQSSCPYIDLFISRSTVAVFIYLTWLAAFKLIDKLLTTVSDIGRRIPDCKLYFIVAISSKLVELCSSLVFWELIGSRGRIDGSYCSLIRPTNLIQSNLVLHTKLIWQIR